jgi:hypothetical protein
LGGVGHLLLAKGWEEEAREGSNPAGVIVGESADENDTADMRMQLEFLVSAMEDGPTDNFERASGRLPGGAVEQKLGAPE